MISMSISGLFLWFVLKTHNVFNMLPFAIHDAINPGGTSEKTFIVLFDIIVALVLLFLCYKIISRRLSKN